MSGRREALQTQGGFTKPATKYIEWASEDKCFRYYDKKPNEEKGQNVLMPLPVRFVVLNIYSTIKGWSDSESSGIYSNEVKDTSKEILEVRTFTKKVITKGLYKDVKDIIANAGGKFTSSIYAMDENGEIINFQIRGISLKQWMEFTKTAGKRLMDEWVSVKTFEEGKKGRVTYSMPIFEFDKSLSSDEFQKADNAFNKLELLLAGRDEQRTSSKEDEVEEDYSDVEDAEFD
jgi:hypothetical protein